MSDQKDERNDLFVELKELDQQIKNLNAHAQNVDEQIAELNSSKQVIHKFKELKKGEEIKVPLAAGVYIEATLNENKKLLANVGTGVLVEKTPDEIMEIFDEQIKELNAYREDLMQNIEKFIKRAEEIQRSFE